MEKTRREAITFDLSRYVPQMNCRQVAMWYPPSPLEKGLEVSGR